MEISYTIPRKLKEEIKIFSKPFTLYIKDITTAGISIALFWMLSSFVHTFLIVPYWLFAIISTVYFVLPAGKSSPGKRKWQLIYLVLISDNAVYRSIDNKYLRGGIFNVRYHR